MSSCTSPLLAVRLYKDSLGKSSIKILCIYLYGHTRGMSLHFISLSGVAFRFPHASICRNDPQSRVYRGWAP